MNNADNGPDISASQQALIEKIAEQVTNKTAPGIAEKAIEEWGSRRAKVFRPKTWTRNDHYKVEVFSGLSFLATVLIVFFTVDDLTRIIHDRIKTRSFFNTWSGEPEFIETTSSAIDVIATRSREANPVSKLVRAALAQNPLMVFQGEETFLETNTAQTFYEGCFAITGFLSQIKPEKLMELAINPNLIELPDPKVCELKVSLSAPTTLNIPFFARLGDYIAQNDDEVRLVVGVARSFSEIVTNIDTEDTSSTARTNNKLSGLEITLHTKIGDPSESGDSEEIPILHQSLGDQPGLQSIGNGYWEIVLNDIVKRPVQSGPTTEQMFHRHHAISVTLKNKALETEDVAPNERINVRVFVFVNTLRKMQ